MRARRTRRHRRLRQSFASLTARNTPWQNRAASRPAPSCGPYAFTHPDRRIAMTRLPLAPLSAAASRIVTIRAWPVPAWWSRPSGATVRSSAVLRFARDPSRAPPTSSPGRLRVWRGGEW